MENEHTLEGIEPDNLLAVLALLGFLRSVQQAEPTWQLRAWWSGSPLRPRVKARVAVTQEQLAEAAARGCQALAEVHAFGDHNDLDHTPAEARSLLTESSREAEPGNRASADLFSALMSDVTFKDEKIRATPYCALFGQGHQHFLERLNTVPRGILPKELAKGKKPPNLNSPAKITEALFQPWARVDATQSFRWDPFEDRRYALRFADPSTDKGLTVHGANRLAAIALPLLTAVPVLERGGLRLAAIGSQFGKRGVVSIRWPIWDRPATLDAIRAMWATRGDRTFAAERISAGKFFCFTRGEEQARNSSGTGSSPVPIPNSAKVKEGRKK